MIRLRTHHRPVTNPTGPAIPMPGLVARTAALVVLLGIFALPALFAAPPGEGKPGPAVDKLIFRAFDVDRAPRDLEAGNMDLYMYSLKTDAAQQLQNDPRFKLYEAPASTVSLLLNPAPAPAGQLNPFSIKEVRQAMQYLVDRNFIANDIYRGMATPMISTVSPDDYDYLTVYDIEKSSGIAYDPDYGHKLITDAMTKAGATMANGVWSYRGQPIRIRIIGRVEDERRNIADMVRTELQKAGFAVDLSYLPFAAAVNAVYSSDPQSFQWHIYTEGWGRSSAQRYDYANINQMLAPWLGNMPGWQETGFWQYKQPELDSLGKQLFRGQFKSLQERNDIYRRMTKIGLDESVRIWLVTAVNSFAARSDVKNLNPDIVAGIRSPWSLREGYVQGKPDLTVGHLWVWTERTTWNPVGGMSDVYSSDIFRYLHDPPIWNHPFTGMPMPMRANYQVETAGPDGTLQVPADAVMWNAGSKRWQTVGGGVHALSKVTFDYSKYFQSKWHNGQPISMADVVYSIAQGFDMAYDPNKVQIETAIGVTSRPFLETFKGFRIVDSNHLEVYVDYWNFIDGDIAAYASPSGLSMPWDLLAAMDDLVFNQRRAAYSDTAAARFNVPWLSLVMDRDARLVDRTLRQFAGSSYVPPGYFQIGGRSLVSPQEANARYKADMDWFASKGNLVISNGPFYLERYDPPAQYAELRAFRDPTYPFKPGDWNFGTPPTLQIGRVGQVNVTAGSPADVAVAVSGPGKLTLHYLLLDPATRSVVTSGDATPGPGGKFTATIPASVTSTLFPGLYSLSFVASSDSIASVVERDVDVNVPQ